MPPAKTATEQPHIDVINGIARSVFGKLVRSVSSGRTADWNGEPTISIELVLNDRPATPIKVLSKMAQQFERAVSDALDPLEPEAFFVFHYVTAAELAELALDD